MNSYTFNIALNGAVHARISDPTTPQNKPLLVFLHYWGGSSSTWYKLTFPDSATSLSDKYTMVAIDLRGWGQSTGPLDGADESQYSIGPMASDVAGLLQHLHANNDTRHLFAHGVVLTGHSMGAKVALATLTLLRTHLLDLVKGLVLIAPAPPTALHLPSHMKEQQKVAYETKESITWSVENVLGHLDRLSKEDMKMIVRDSLGGNPLAKMAWPLVGMAEDITADLKKVLLFSGRLQGLRVRILVGEVDPVETKERVDQEVASFLAARGLDVSVKVVPGARHLIPLEAPEAVQRELLEF
ncbi:alpha/beta fold hydrolase [Aspergillus homomorphus CBS 101889]|uniref:Putative alpha/beta fold family hydrolase n=1 Tax=Aspergillus homomorphus (strain CBS 101889) TaxID=1450537 RepID=A0A395HVH5_ASPHC|nr:putative alpha/beta fold family hydrolase [Aspergillus homomorphus CBS 101889]RAL11800.1 putative alpha/beta fold family hydrolase [Aspergillus homomorphus CBS 101889]